MLCLLAGGGREALVNERPPADRAALERHWNLDCPAVAAKVRSAASAYRDGAVSVETLRGRLDEVMEDLSRCAALDRRDGAGEEPYAGLQEAVERLRIAFSESDGRGITEALEALATTGPPP